MGISAIVLMVAIKSMIKAPRISFGGWLSLGCCNGESLFFTITSSGLLFVVALQEPSGFARQRNRAQGVFKCFVKIYNFLILSRIC